VEVITYHPRHEPKKLQQGVCGFAAEQKDTRILLAAKDPESKRD
jgi:hypothetical protein